MTVHIGAKKEEVAKVVLLAGDPLRAKKIALTYLTNPKLVSEVRNMLMYTGTYQGTQLTIGSHGMGVPSMGIYAYELFKFYDVETIIRIGSAGSYQEDLKIFDVFNIKETHGDNDFLKLIGGPDRRVVHPTPYIYDVLNQTATTMGVNLKTGLAHCSDVFYNPEGFDVLGVAKQNNYSVVEMESYALFAAALVTKKQAGALLTISDSFVSHEELSASERENSFTKMVEIALQSALDLNNHLVEGASENAK